MDVGAILEAVGGAVDGDPLIRGATVLGAAAAATLGLTWRLARRKKADDRARVSVDAPAGADVEVRVGGRP